MRTESTCWCTQLGHLANLLKSKVNSQQNLSPHEVWKPKHAEDALKHVVSRFYRPTGKSPDLVLEIVAAVGT